MAGRKRPRTPAARQRDAMTDAVRQLQDEVRELRNAVVELRSEAGQYRAETEQLRKELEARGSGSGSSCGKPRRRSPAPAHALGRTCFLSGRIFRTADQQIGRPVPDQSGGGVKISPPAFGHCAAESVQQSRIHGQSGRPHLGDSRDSECVRTNLWRQYAAVGNWPRSIWAAFCRSQNLGQPATRFCRRICRTFRMASISVWFACAPPACGWIGKILPSWRDRTMLSSLRSRQLHSLRWRCPLSAIPATSGDGFLKFASNTASIFRKGRASRCRAASWTTSPASCLRPSRPSRRREKARASRPTQPAWHGLAAFLACP